MNPIQITENLRESMTRYLLTTFDVNRDGKERELREELRRSFMSEGALFNGPFLEMTLPYVTGKSLLGLNEEGVISSELLSLSSFQQGKPIRIDIPLYRHQEQAIKKLLVEEQNLVVSSGTGSGKTECFLIPILNDLLVDPSPGVRAVIIYPLNALVNDQLDRLRELLKGTSITFGKYTGELPQDYKTAARQLIDDPLPNEIICRDQIQFEGKIPQILITNYAMLEYLLLRPEDAPLFNSGKWKFIVLDEAHTYAGTQGIEIGHLMRRLRHRLDLEPTDIRCIATSATLTSDDASEAAGFAETLYGAPFSEESIIFGQVDKDFISEAVAVDVSSDCYLNEAFPTLIEVVRSETASTEDIALLAQDIGLIDQESLKDTDSFLDNPRGFLYHELSHNSHLQELKNILITNNGPLSVTKAANQLFPDLINEEDRIIALYHLIELGSMARIDEDSLPLIPARYHLFARSPQGIWVCLNPECPGKDTHQHTAWSKVYSTRHESCDLCGAAVYPLTVCRTCGQSFIRVEVQDGKYMTEADPGSSVEACYYTWSPIEENEALSDLDEEEWQKLLDSERKYRQTEEAICLSCRQPLSQCKCAGLGKKSIPRSLFRVDEIERDKNKGIRNIPLRRIKECPRCHDIALLDTEIATPIILSSTSPLAVLTYELYGSLPKSDNDGISQKPGGGRKLLGFYDSRQGAARFAAYMQAAANDQIYRHIIPLAISQFEEQNQFAPDLEAVVEKCYEIGLVNRIFHNDPQLADEFKGNREPTQPGRQRIKNRLRENILAEISTKRRQRQSLESLGLVAVKYFDATQEPDFSSLSQRIGLSEDQTRTCVDYLLDGLRDGKIIELPEGVAKDSEVFGRNKFSPRIVRRNPDISKHELSWIGETERQYRRRLIKQILESQNLDSSEAYQIRTLNEIFTWLIDEAGVLSGSGSQGYQLGSRRLFFTRRVDWYQCDSCLRITARGGTGLPCQHPRCEGQLVQVDLHVLLQDNHYRNLFTRSLLPMRVEEHTAQLDSDKAREYQEAFKSGDINILSCSTTFEMGIDLGDLQAVVLNNIPPTVANYKQRSGRAGRRKSGTAFILAWASERPHDQTYYKAPEEIINGQVRVPHLALANQFIQQRHVNAILFSEYMRYRFRSGYQDLKIAGPFFDTQVVEQPHFDGIARWMEENDTEIDMKLSVFARILGEKEEKIQDWKSGFNHDLLDIKNHRYLEVSSYYCDQIERINALFAQSGTASARDLFYEREGMEKLLERLRKTPLINYLSDQGALPSYSFPLHTVELALPPDKAGGLKLQRDLKQAIREYAPGQEVVADKRIWKSSGLMFFRDTPKRYHYRICHNCNHLRIGLEAGIPLSNADGPCPVCGELPKNSKRAKYQYLQPDGFRAAYDSGKPAGQAIEHPWNLTRSAVIPHEPDETIGLGNLVDLGYSRKGELLYVNEGESGSGFRICLKCGTRLSPKDTSCKNKFRGEVCGGPFENVTLGFKETTDTLQLSFNPSQSVTIPSPDDRSFWLSLMHALIQGACHALQIERTDIDGVLFPRRLEGGGWQQTIVLFDDVPGGAGHVFEIRKEFVKVISEALKVVNCVDCAPDSSCYHCLRDYNNQFDHAILQRGPAANFLEALLASLRVTDDPGTPNPVVALNLPRWLMQAILRAHESVTLFVDGITLDAPSGESRNWLDLILQLLRRKIPTTLAITTGFESLKDPVSLSIARYLQVLLESGLELVRCDQRPEWPVIIDPSSEGYARLLRPVTEGPFILGDETGQSGLETIIMRQVIKRIYDETRGLMMTPITQADLNPPANISVLNIESTDRGKKEREFFGSVFARPVRRLLISDRYLHDQYRLVDRVGAYIKLSSEAGGLEEVRINTLLAGSMSGGGSSKDAQDKAFVKLKASFPNVRIDLQRGTRIEHDRYVLLERVDGTRARILIGKGLDFIRPDGEVEKTYVVIEDPMT